MTVEVARPKLRSYPPALPLALCAALLGCTGAIGAPGGDDPEGGPGTQGGGPGVVTQAGVDPGRVGIRRLNNTEYNNTVRDLLGTAAQPAAVFLAEEGLHFDNTATALGMTPGQYEGYLAAAEALLVEALQDDAQRARFMTCTPVGPADPCARQIIDSFGAQIYRRPLEQSELERALRVYEAEVARGGDGSEAVAQALRAMLSAALFLYRMELDPDPTSTAPRALTGYELASRLSYLHWSSMPDPALFEAAGSGALLDPSVLEAEVERLVADHRASAFVESFAGQWLDIRKLFTHSVTPQVFPTYTSALSDAIAGEGYRWFEEFLTQDRPLTEWFTADFNYVDAALAQHYGMPAPVTPHQLSRVEVQSDQRQGFLGLASFLTHTSFPSRTSPTLRGVWVLTELLCETLPIPPGNIPELEESAAPADEGQPAGSENVRERLERHRSDPACSGCHAVLDPIGLGLERFDAIGGYRESYGNGDVIMDQGTLPDGTTFSGSRELSAILQSDARFSACARDMLFTYAMGREIEDYDAATLQGLQERWATRGLTLKNLMKEVVLSDAFRFRRGEPE